MSFSVTVIQTVAAFIIFVAGYVMLLVSIICVSVLASCIYKGGRFMKAYTLRTYRTLEVENPTKNQVVNSEAGKAA